MRPFIVGIAGGTASGKTFLAKQLLKLGGEDKVAVIELDRYYRSQDHLTPEQRALLNYDHPEILEFELLIEHITQLIKGIAIEAPHYDFSTHSRNPLLSKVIKPLPVIVVEGILALNPPELRQLFDLKVFVDTPQDIRLARRLERDTRERGRTVESVRAQWAATVQPMHAQYCEPSRIFADIIVSEADNQLSAGASVWREILERTSLSARR